jgi:hypothetical protein
VVAKDDRLRRDFGRAGMKKNIILLKDQLEISMNRCYKQIEKIHILMFLWPLLVIH